MQFNFISHYQLLHTTIEQNEGNGHTKYIYIILQIYNKWSIIGLPSMCSMPGNRKWIIQEYIFIEYFANRNTIDLLVLNA